MREPVRLERWMPLYRQICLDFGYSERQDVASAESLWSMISSRDIPALSALEYACPKRVVLCGDAPGLDAKLDQIGEDEYVVCADGATSQSMTRGRVPDAIVTDLDGDVEDQAEANAEGAILFVHAHGDNMGQVRRWTPQFEGVVIGTCQCVPVGGLLNFGGFTDGDRAACIFSALGADEIDLVGFDFANPSEKDGRDPEVKRRKLAWAERILDELRREGCSIRWR